MIPYVGTIKLLEKPIEVPIRDKEKNPIMVMVNGTLEQKKIVYKFDNHVVRKRAPKVASEMTENVTESSAHALTA